MKILILSFEYPPDTGFGGIGTYSWYHARALVKLGHEVHVLAGSLGPAEMKPQEHDGVQVYRIRARGRLMDMAGRLGNKSLHWTRNRLETALSMYHGLRRLVRTVRPEIIEMPECGGEGLLVNWLTRIPTLVRFHSPAELIMPFYDLAPADHRWCSRVERFGIRGGRFFSACSAFLAGEVRDRLGVRRPIEVIPNGIDLELFDAQEQIDAKSKYGIPKDRPMILFCARMERRKGIHICQALVPDLLERHEVAFVLAGDDLFGHVRNELLPELKDRKLKGSIHVLGRLGHTDVRSCLRQADIFFFPSTWENHPYSCLEAMASSKALVSSDCGGMPEMIVDGENGLLARNEDAGSFRAALERLIADAGLRRRLGEAARRSVEEHYRDTTIASRSAAYYARCLGGKAGS